MRRPAKAGIHRADKVARIFALAWSVVIGLVYALRIPAFAGTTTEIAQRALGCAHVANRMQNYP